MITNFEIQVQGISTDRDRLQQLNSPTEMLVEKSLNSVSAAWLVYPASFEDSLFSTDEDFLFPAAMRLMTQLQEPESNDISESIFFQGLLCSYSIQASGCLVLEYRDPLIVATEVDRSEAWQKTSLKEVVSQALRNASAERGGRSLKVSFQDEAEFPIESLTNIGQTDFEFVRDLAEKFGFRFFFHHAEKGSDEVTFFKPNFSRLPDSELAYEDIQSTASIKISTLKAPNTVFVQRGTGVEEVGIETYQNQFSKCFEKKVALRERLGIELNSHLYCPGISQREAQEMAQGEFLGRILEGDRLHFQSERVFPIGSLIKVNPSDDSIVTGRRFHGVYLIDRVRSRLDGFRWLHEYEGVRP
ncbi:MAG: hypothetical protein EA369_07390 [Bradymonadales bacterium]|nr:MAG: hypothetical protein EA369_07390 [Bradymonadales bacterium]